MKRISLLLVLFFSRAFADVPHSAISNSTGGAGAASVEAGDATFLNPANLVHIKDRVFYSTFQKDLVGIGVIENDKGSIVPGALSYFGDKHTQYFALSLADFVVNNFAFGLSASYWQVKLDDQSSKRSTTYNGTAGVTWTPTEHLGIGFIASNFLTPPEKFRSDESLMPPSSRFGFNYLFSNWFRWRFDVITFKNNDWENWTPETGFETYFGEFMSLRIGYNKPQGLKESWSAGLGLSLPRFSVDYASVWNANGGTEQRHSVDLTIPF
jgi:hypothetical protein